jgi:tetratricopeptide (TPR) repeat protein
MNIPSMGQFVRQFARPDPIRPYPSTDPRSRIVELLSKGEFNEVIAGFSEDDSRCLNGLTWAYFLDDQFDNAERVAQKAVETFSQDLASALSHLAIIKVRQGEDKTEVYALFEEALRLCPSSHTAHSNRLCFASMQKDHGELKKAIESLLNSVPNLSSHQSFVNFLNEDADLTWARGQDVFKQITKTISQ